jgi:16S rRNA (guanine966-N2)-methyltransferase
MRIIAGKYKGRHLVSFKADHIRPTMDRVKETLFNKWMHYTDGARVLDLFAGTGSLGLEALSRGAVHVCFVEKSKKSIQILQENIRLLKIAAEEVTIIQKDVLAFVQTFSGEPYDLIVVDPPFTEKMAHEVMVAISQSRLYGEHTRIAIEALKQERIDFEYGILTCYDRQDYGDKTLSLFGKRDENA